METEEREEIVASITDLTDKIEQLLGYVANEEAKFANWKVTFSLLPLGTSARLPPDFKSSVLSPPFVGHVELISTVD